MMMSRDESDPRIQATLSSYEKLLTFVQNIDVAGMKAKGNRSREEFLEKAGFRPPQLLRLIDCKSTCEEEQVVLVGYDRDDDQQQLVGYSAISHTYGMEVYGVFDCECTSKCLANVPRCSGKPCPQHLESTDPRNRVVKDILNMCAILWEAGVEYAWHDGVCIAQHNPEEVDDAIKHMGWIYAHARETIVFLHYVGRPMAPISNSDDDLYQTSRWQTRVWTLQEGAVSKYRRYCVRVGVFQEQIGDCRSLQEFEEKLDLWYREDSSKVAIIEEEAYWKLLMELYTVLLPLCHHGVSLEDVKPLRWLYCISDCLENLMQTCFQFPSASTAIVNCSFRESKHEGDRINSILGLSGVRDFVAPKDIDVEASTMEFFRKQGQQGLARALFTANLLEPKAENLGARCHTWLPSLSNPLMTVYEAVVDYKSLGGGEDAIDKSFMENFIAFTVLQDGKMELTGELACIAVKFTVRSSSIESDARHDLAEAHGLDGVAVRAQRAAENPASLMAIDLRYHNGGFTASLAQASSMELGTAASPIAGWEQQQELPLTAAALGAPLTAAAQASNLLKLGLAILPIVDVTSLGPWIEGHEINDGESFCAHLVLSLPALRQHQQLYSVPLSDWSLPALLVQGSLHAPVYKIGCFLPAKGLKDLLTILLPHLTIIHKLVIA